MPPPRHTGEFNPSARAGWSPLFSFSCKNRQKEADAKPVPKLCENIPSVSLPFQSTTKMSGSFKKIQFNGEINKYLIKCFTL